MQNLLYNISQVLGITILHSLWQGLIVFTLLRLFLLARPATSSQTKYWVSYSALFITLGWFIITLFNELNKYEWLSTTALQITPLTLPAIIHEVNRPANELYFTISRYMPYLTMIYVVGVAVNALKLIMSWNSIYRIRQNISDAGFESTISRLSMQLKISKFVKVAFSEWVDVPCVTGFIRPIILLPMSVTSQLSVKEVEAILLHELAHVKRHDFLLNFIQQVIGIVLFFNPFARLIDKTISRERENCCDDVVVHVTGSPLIYAQALLKLEENKQQQWQLALAAVTKKYELLNRIERIMKTKTQTVNIRPVLITLLALTCAVTSIAWLNPEVKNGKIVIKNAPAIHKVVAAISAPAPAETIEKPVRKRKKNISFKFVNDTTKALNDTTIKGKKYKIVVEDENGNKKEYNSVSDLPDKDKNDFLGNTAEFRYGMDSSMTALRKFYTSDAFKKQIAESQKMGLEVAKKINTPEFKKLQKELVAKSVAMAKQFNTPAFRKNQKVLIEKSLEMAHNTYGPELQKMVAEITAHAADPDYFQSEEFKKQTESLGKYYDSPEFKAGIEKAAKYYDSPEFKKQIKDMEKYYDSPEFQKKMENIGKEFNSPAFQKKMEKMGKEFEKLGKQFESPEFQKKMEKMGKDMEKIGEKMEKEMKEKEKMPKDSVKNQ